MGATYPPNKYPMEKVTVGARSEPMTATVTPERTETLLARLDAGATFVGYPEGFGESWQSLARDAANEIRRLTHLAAKPAEAVDERPSIIEGVKTVLEFAIGLASDAERLIPDSEPKRLRGMLNNIRQGYLKPAVDRLNSAARSSTAEPKHNKEHSP